MTSSPSLPASTDASAPLCVLILEDDPLLRDRILVPKLSQFGFDVMASGREVEMHEALGKRLPDLVLLDVGLPDSNGFEVARKLRLTSPHIGIVMLTGLSASTDLVRGLTEGADAYLSKPVEIDVLVATLHSVARRLQPATAKHAGVWHLSADGWFLVSPAHGRVKLSKAERRLMETLMKQPDEVFLREDLIAALAEDVSAFDPHRLDSLIHRLRRKVLTTVGEPLPLKAMHGIGYVFAL